MLNVVVPCFVLFQMKLNLDVVCCGLYKWRCMLLYNVAVCINSDVCDCNML